MNRKEDVLKRVVQAAIDCCSYENADGTLSITAEMVMSTDRLGENVSMTRCMLAKKLNGLGYNNESIGRALGRSESTVRDMLRRSEDFRATRYAYRVAEGELDVRVKAIIGSATE